MDQVHPLNDEGLPEKQWTRWIASLQAIAQTGMTFAHTPFDKERYEQLVHIVAENGELCAAKTLS